MPERVSTRGSRQDTHGVFFVFTTSLEQTIITRQTNAQLMTQRNFRGGSVILPVACVMGCTDTGEAVQWEAEETLQQTRRQPYRRAEVVPLMRRTTPLWAVVLAVLFSIAIGYMVGR